MAMSLLKQIAGARLPVVFYRKDDIDAVRVLRAAGLVIALIRSSSDAHEPCGEAQVLTITQKGREELAKFGSPESAAPRWRFQMPWIKTAGFIPRRGKSPTFRQPPSSH